jgi:hypothetical protein
VKKHLLQVNNQTELYMDKLHLNPYTKIQRRICTLNFCDRNLVSQVHV